MLYKNTSKSVLVIEMTENSSKNSFQNHQLNIDGKTPCRRLRSKSQSFQDHPSTSFKTMEKSAKNEDSFKTNDQKTGKSVLSGPSIKSAKKDPNPLLSRPMGLKMYQNRVLSRPLRMDPKTTPLKIELKTFILNTWSLLMRRVKPFQILRQERRCNQSQNSHQVVHHLQDQDSTPSTWSPDQYPPTVPGIFKCCSPTVLTALET